MNGSKELKVIFAGDFAPCRRYEKFILDGNDPLAGGINEIISSADLAFVNVECPMTISNNRLPKSGPNLKASPECAKVLSRFSVAGLANNHILDYQCEGVGDTLSALKSLGIECVGAGLNLKEAKNIFYKKVDNVTIAIIAVAEQEFNIAGDNMAGCAPLEVIDNLEQINEARDLADIVIITIHGGNEYLKIPRPGLRKLCRFYTENGVDAVICHHPHVAGAYEIYKQKLIAYSIGNFVFDHNDPPEGWDEGYLVQLNINTKEKKISSFEFHPFKQSVEIAGVKLMDGDSKIEAIKRLERLRILVESEEEYLAEWFNFVKTNADKLVVNYHMPFRFKGLGFLTRKFRLADYFSSRKSKWDRLNLIRCRSHLEALKSALEMRFYRDPF